MHICNKTYKCENVKKVCVLKISHLKKVIFSINVLPLFLGIILFYESINNMFLK